MVTANMLQADFIAEGPCISAGFNLGNLIVRKHDALVDLKTNTLLIRSQIPTSGPLTAATQKSL